MDNVENNDGLGRESWGDELLNFQYRHSTDGTDATSESSDFSPAQLAIMGRRISANTAPLPKGVKDVDWQPPSLTGLQHSSPIFETERDKWGTLRVSAKELTSNNRHFRTWQEDNGIAATFASKTAEKQVDGHKMTVAIGRASARPASADAAKQPGTGAIVPDIEPPRPLRRRSSESTGGTPVLGEMGAAEPSLLSTPRHPLEDAVGDLKRKDCARENEGDASLPVEGASAEPPLSSTDASTQKETPPIPQRPKDGVASSHARQPRPGRSLSSKGASMLPKEENRAEEVRHPSPATSVGGACEPPLVISEGGVEHHSSGIGPTVEAGIGGEVGGQDRQQRQAGDAKGKHEGTEETSGSTASPKVFKTTSMRWWGRSRSPRAPSPQPAQQSKLPAVSVAPGSSDEAPAKQKWLLSFRRRKPR